LPGSRDRDRGKLFQETQSPERVSRHSSPPGGDPRCLTKKIEADRMPLKPTKVAEAIERGLADSQAGKTKDVDEIRAQYGLRKL
jgi:hypothetical protein